MDIQDHRRIGQRQELFDQQEEGTGMVFWHLRRLRRFARRRHETGALLAL